MCKVKGSKSKNGPGTDHQTSESMHLLETKFGKSPQGSYASYQLSTTKDKFKVYCNISSIPRVDPSYTHTEPIINFPRFSLKPPAEQFVIPGRISEAEKTLLERLQVDEEKKSIIFKVQHGDKRIVKSTELPIGHQPKKVEMERNNL